MDVFGDTRSRVAHNYALLTADTHVSAPLIDWTDSTAVVHISAEMGARFTQYTATMATGASSGLPGKNIQRFVFVRSGNVTLELNGTHKLTAGGYAFIPADTDHVINSSGESVLVVFEKQYQHHEKHASPEAVIGNVGQVDSEAFLGDEDAQLQTLLPIHPSFDMAVNLFTYQPGATLPFVEIHVMEHGLLMTAGKGVYRLGEDYFPVTEGDIIWMASYCPQWFVAMGKTPASYLYYKDIHRDRLADK